MSHIYIYISEMNATKYRKWYLAENWSDNRFVMITKKVNVPRCFPCPYSINFQRSHPKILSEEGFWISHNEICVGYYSVINPNIFRPVFSHTRQNLLDELNSSIDNPNLRYARKKYLVGLDKYLVDLGKNKLPMDCVKIILSFIHKHL